SGSAHTVLYVGGAAKISVRLQECFGLDVHPTLYSGKLLLTIELLSPSRQPIATTQNLPSFWKSTYPEVRKELRGRYPKHFWPEDPLSMQGTTGTKKAADRKRLI
ncbi:MAG TPA: ATP-dependent helicase C-terminal domain-containing protein, partial [Turneriella sp.]|nr:ATP-dependent helicase C-terminal domain-containing protein [Turneriella sp.]